jgi:hypothetical protein
MANSKRNTRFKLFITRELITDAVQRQSAHCLIAEAIRQQVPNACMVTVDMRTTRWSNPVTEERFVYLTPQLAQSIIIKFDQGIEIEPTEISMRNPVQIVRMRKGQPPRDPGEPRKRPVMARMRSDGVIIGGRLPRIANMARLRRYGAKTFIE